MLFFFSLQDQAMVYRHLLQMVLTWITRAPSPKKQDNCAWAHADRGTHRSILLFCCNTTEIYAAYATGKFIQPTGCGNDSAGESSPQVCNNPSPNGGVELDKEAQHCPSSAATVLMLWEVLRSGCSSPLTSHIRKLSDLRIGLKLWFRQCTLESCWLCCSVCSLIMPCSPERAKVHYHRGGDVHFHGQVGASLSKTLQEMQLEKENSFLQQQLVSPSCKGEFQQKRETRQSQEESHGHLCKRHRWKLFDVTDHAIGSLLPPTAFKAWEEPIPTGPGPSCPAPRGNGG